MLNITCGIVLYNTEKDDIIRIVRSLTTAGEISGHVLRISIIDNSGTITGAHELEELKIDFFPSVGNIGFGRAHNLLMRDAFAKDCDAYLALNPDGFAHPNMLEAMGALVEGADANVLVEARQFPLEHPKIYDPDTFETPWCSGACLLIPKRLGLQLGGFDDGFFMYCEDVDFSWRARLEGARCLVAPNAYFFHDVVGRGESRFVNWHMALSMERLLSKWGGNPPHRLRRRLDEMLAGIPDSERKRGTISLAEPIKLNGRTNPSDFDHDFGFAVMRWG